MPRQASSRARAAPTASKAVSTPRPRSGQQRRFESSPPSAETTRSTPRPRMTSLLTALGSDTRMSPPLATSVPARSLFRSGPARGHVRSCLARLHRAPPRRQRFDQRRELGVHRTRGMKTCSTGTVANSHAALTGDALAGHDPVPSDETHRTGRTQTAVEQGPHGDVVANLDPRRPRLRPRRPFLKTRGRTLAAAVRP